MYVVMRMCMSIYVCVSVCVCIHVHIREYLHVVKNVGFRWYYVVCLRVKLSVVDIVYWHRAHESSPGKPR